MAIIVDSGNFHQESSNNTMTSFTTANVTVGASDNMLIDIIPIFQFWLR